MVDLIRRNRPVSLMTNGALLFGRMKREKPRWNALRVRSPAMLGPTGPSAHVSSGPVGCFHRIRPGAGRYRYTVTRAGALFRLSREQTGRTREWMCRPSAQEDSGRRQETAEYMDRLTTLE